MSNPCYCEGPTEEMLTPRRRPAGIWVCGPDAFEDYLGPPPKAMEPEEVRTVQCDGCGRRRSLCSIGGEVEGQRLCGECCEDGTPWPPYRAVCERCGRFDRVRDYGPDRTLMDAYCAETVRRLAAAGKGDEMEERDAGGV